MSENVKQAVKKQLAESGVVNAGELARIVTDMAMMQEVSTKEQAKVYRNETARQIYTEITHSEGANQSEWLQDLSEQNKNLFQNMNFVNLTRIVEGGYLTKVKQVLNGEISELQLSANDDILSNSGTLNEGDETNVENNSQKWGQDRNSKGGIRPLQENLGGDNDQGGADGIKQRGSQSLRNSKNRGSTTLDSTREGVLKHTTIMNKDGTPKAVYHFTENIDFNTFAVGDIGFHFGNEEQANNRGKILNKTGRIIKANLNIKNPLNISTDIMNWKPGPLALKLFVDKIISNNERISIEKLQIEGGGAYDSPAAIELRRILSEKGYDGIVYENMFEGDGESYIAFYPEQVIIIDDGKNQNSQYNSDTESGNEDGEKNSPKGVTSLLSEKDGRHHTTAAEQQYVKDICAKLGRKVVFEHIGDTMRKMGIEVEGPLPDGYIDDNNVIHIGFTVENPVLFVLKHELTHFIENDVTAHSYFLNAVADSETFEKWVRQKGFKTIDDYKKKVISVQSKFRKNFGEAEAYNEIVADFVGDKLFGGMNNISDRFINEFQPKHRNKIIQAISDFFKHLKEKLFGVEGISQEILTLENEFIKAYKKADAFVKNNPKEKNTAESGEVKFSFKTSSSGMANDSFDIANLTEEDFDKYSEEQYNDFGWVRYNGVLSASEYKTLLSRYADYKHNGDKYPTNRFGEAVIFSTECPDVIMYVKGSIESPQISKIVRINANNSIEATIIQEGVIENERDKLLLPYEPIKDAFGEEVFIISKKRDFASFQKYQSKYEGGNSKKDNPIDRIQQNRAGSNGTGEGTHNKASRGIQINKFSIPVKTTYELLLEQYENGEITREDFLSAVEREKTTNPFDIANLTEEDADTTPHHNRKQGESDGDEKSKFYDSVIESKIFDQKFKNEVAMDSFIEKYKSVTNKETLRAAAKELDAGGQAYVNKWFSLSPERSSLIDTAVGFILMDRYQRVGDYESAVAAAEKVREFGTGAGQQVQIFSILGRLDPNSMAVYAQKELSKAFEIMVKNKTRAWISKNKERFELTEEDIEYIRRRTIQAAMLPEGRDKAIKLAEISTRIQDKLPADRGQALRALQRISMLLNVKTNIRNVTGNSIMVPVFITSDFFGSGIDKFVSKFTGVRTTGMFDAKSVKGFKKGMFETMDDFKRQVNTRNQEMNRFDVGQGKSFNENHNGKLAKQLNDCAKVLNALDRFTSFCLEMGDRPFYEMWFINSLNNQMKLNKVDEATPEMISIASLEALQRTWQDTNKVVQAVSSAKKSLNFVNIGGYGLGDVLIKFVKTPANLTKAIFDFSPAGLFKSMAADGVTMVKAVQTGQFETSHQKKFVDSLSKGIAGTILYVIAATLVKKGLLKGKGDEDKDASNFEKYIQGIPEYSIKLFGKWWSYEWAQPVGAVAAIVSDYMESKEENPDNEWYNGVWEAIKSGGEVLYNQSFMKSIQILFTADSFIDGLMEELMNEPSVYIPQLLSQFASSTDDYRRITYESEKPFESALNNVKYKIPGLRQSLEKQVDVLGRDVPNSQGNVFNAFFNPGNTYTDTSNEVTDEIYDIYKQTGDVAVIPRVAPNYIEVKKHKIVFSADEKVEFQKTIGKRSADILGEMFASDEYQKLKETEKAKAIKEVYTYAVSMAKCEINYDYKIVSDMVGYWANGKAVLTQSTFNSYSERTKKAIVEDYFLSKAEINLNGNTQKEARYFINKAKQ